MRKKNGDKTFQKMVIVENEKNKMLTRHFRIND